MKPIPKALPKILYAKWGAYGADVTDDLDDYDDGERVGVYELQRKGVVSRKNTIEDAPPAKKRKRKPKAKGKRKKTRKP